MSYHWLRHHWNRVLAAVVAVVGVVLLVAGWLGVSDSSLTTEQIPYLVSGAVGGLFALGVAATLWLSADLGNEFAKLDEIYRWMQGDEGESLAELEAAVGVIGDGEGHHDEQLSAAARRGPLQARPRAGV